MRKIFAYIRASNERLEVLNQRHEIMHYAKQRDINIDDFIIIESADKKGSRQKRINALKSSLHPHDCLLVANLARLGRSTGEVILLLDQLIAFDVAVTVIREGLHLSSNPQDAAGPNTVNMLTLFANIEREFMSMRTKESIATKKAAGSILGKPKGTIQASIYDKDRARIEELLQLGLSRRRIVEKHLGYGTSNSLGHYIRTRGLSEKTEEVTIPPN